MSNHDSDSPGSENAGVGSPAKLIHEVLPVGLLQCNCHVVGDPVTHEAVVIDPGDDIERILGVIARYDLKVRAILITHAHIDHVGGLRKMREATGAPVMMHHADLRLYQVLEMQAQWIRWPTPELTDIDDFLSEGKSIKWGNYELRVIHTPGHSEGSVCLYLPRDAGALLSADAMSASGGSHEPGLLFAGDTLFEGSIGRTDLWGGSMKEIMRSLKTKVIALPDETIVFPGHGPITTIGAERETNQFLQGL